MRTKTFLMLLALSVLLVNPALAQGNLLSYGDNVVGTLSAGAPLGFYTFNGAAGDLVSIQVIGITPDLDPAISLNGPTQQQLASNDNDPASPGTTDARVTLSLPQDGIYTVLVSSVSGVNGDFLLRLSGQQPVPATGLSDAPLDVSIAPGQPPQIFSFEANPAAPITLTVSSSTPGFSFRVVVRDPSGQTIALLTASTLVGLNLPPGSGTYTAEIAPLDPNVAGQVSVSTGAAAVAPPPPAATQEAAPPPAEIDAASQVCQVGTGTTPVNVRSGPNTDYAVIGQIQPGQRLNVSGVSGTWFQVVLPDGRPGWVRRDVVVPFGPCDSVPQVDTAGIQPPGPAQTEEAGPGQLPTATFTPDPGQQAIQATPTYTYTPPAQQQQPTPTYTYTPPAQQQQPTPTYTYTPPAQQQQPTATYTPTPLIAPEDTRFNGPLVIPLDTTSSVTEFVSYPGGDREDRVLWDITGMNPNAALAGGRARLVISASCFGIGTEYIQFSVGGQTYSCGQTVVDREVTYDSRTGQVTITAIGGENTYVQWALTGTATRVN